MRIEIRDMFEDYIDEDAIDMKNIKADDLDIGRIRRLTMEKISVSENKGRITGLRKPARVALLAAIISVLLIGSVSAAVILSRVRIDTDLGEQTYSLSDGSEYTYDVGGQFTIEGREDAKNEVMGFRLGYFPEFDMSDADSTITPLRESLGFYIEGARIIEEKNYASSDDFYWSEDGTDDDFSRIDSYISSPKLDEDLSAAGLTGDYLEGAYDHYIVGDENRAFSVDIYSFSKNDQQYITENSIEFVKSGELRGMEATYYTMESFYSDRPRTEYCLLLADEADGAVITIVGNDGGFEEIEKIAEGIEVVHTGIENKCNDNSFRGLFSDIMFG